MKSWDELITPEEQKRMSEYKRTETVHKTAPSSRILAELGTLYGWTAVRDALENNISPSLMFSLIKEGRHLHNIRLAEQYRLTFECLTSAFSKHGDQHISRIIDQLGKE
ncbi:MAG: hypothetical protein [Namikivirus sakae]|uniref:Uncharacterized protein n=1 Tax=Bacteriophage sp. TaxID=38018 RepID=A0ABY5TS88_9VIRU|nr:MAG: hypothetical protein [Bacteriophage sp.]